MRREWFGSKKRRYVHSTWYQRKLIEKTTIDDEESNRQQYVSLKNVETKFLFTNSSHHDDLSPLECIENGVGYQSIFRSKTNTKKPPRQRRSRQNQTSLLDFHDDASPRDSVATSGATSFASSGLYSPSSEVLKSEHEPCNMKRELPIRRPLSERSDHLHYNISRFDQTISTPNTKVIAKLDYTPSPLSMVSASFNESGGFLVLASQDENTSVIGKAMPIDEVIDILEFRALKYIVVDALNPDQSKQ